MKRIISAALCAVLCTGIFAPAYAADTDMQNALAAVKTKIELPSELSDFRAKEKGTQEKSFVFTWSDAENEESIRVEADEEGRIRAYGRNYDINPDNQKFLPRLMRTDARLIAEEFLMKAVPELFADDSDKLVLSEESGTPQPGSSWYNFSYDRVKDGVPVRGNSASVSVETCGDEAYVTWCAVEWDYDARFSAEREQLANPEESFFAAFPIELRYERVRERQTNESGVRLIYNYADLPGYINAADGKIVEPYYETNENGFLVGASGGATAEDASADKESSFTEEEIAELEGFAGLISVQNAEKRLRALPELGLSGEIKLRDSSIYRRIQYDTSGEKEKFIMTLYFASDDERRSVNATLDAATGELLKLYSYSPYDGDESKTTVDLEKFIRAAAPDKYSECEQYKDNGDYSARLRRIIGGVPYENNGISISCDAHGGFVRSYSVTWDEDIDGFAAAEDAIGIDAARAKLMEYAPLEKVYVPTESEYLLCYGLAENCDTGVCALSGEELYPKEDEEEISYSDIGGHWAEKAVRALAAMGFTERSDRFEPDSKITQEKLLRLILNAVWGHDYSDDTDEFYSFAQRRRLITEAEKNPTAEVVRADAFVFMIRAMGYENIAKLSDIFSCNFADSGLIEREKVGYAAILSGMNIISGDGENLRAGDMMTNAEAAALIYGYLEAAQ